MWLLVAMLYIRHVQTRSKDFVNLSDMACTQNQCNDLLHLDVCNYVFQVIFGNNYVLV